MNSNVSDHRYRGPLKFEYGRSFKAFSIEQVYPSNKLGEGPYRVMFRGIEVFRAEFQGDCKNHIVEMEKDFKKVQKEKKQIEESFKVRWNLPGFPGDDEI